MFEFPSWYTDFLARVPVRVLNTITHADELSWLMWASFAAAALAFVLGARSFGRVNDWERYAGTAVATIGVVAGIPGILMAGFYPIVGAGIVVAAVVGVVAAISILFLMMAGGS